MLTPQQLLALLHHSEHDVRLRAAEFFGRLADASPPETAAHLWQAMDQFGDVAGFLDIKERTSFLRILKELPQDQASMERALDLLKKGTSDENTTANLFRLFLALPIDFVDQHRDEILARVDGETRGQIQHRLEMRSMTGEQIWEQFIRLGEETEEIESSSEVDFKTASRLIAAMAAHPELVITRAMELLDASEDRYWPETWCIELLGKLRHSPAIDVIIRKMVADQGDFMHSAAAAALGRMDAQLTVPKLRDGYDHQVFELEEEDETDIYFRMRFPDALSKTPDPLAESALIQLLEKETDPELISSICGGLIDLCSTEGLEPLRKVVLEEKYDGSVCDVKQELVALCKMVGFQPPELPQWEKEVKDRRRDAQRRTSKLKKMGLSRETFGLMQQFLGKGAKPPKPAAPQPLHSTKTARPFRREEPKIGRNDPCRCGSGKKFKKCCGK